MDENLKNKQTSSTFHQPYSTRYGVQMCAREQDIDMDYPIVIFSSNKIHRFSL
jgi:hypothetical protein